MNQDLYSIVFGESVLNDAVAIILFKVMNGLLKENEEVSGNDSHLEEKKKKKEKK